MQKSYIENVAKDVRKRLVEVGLMDPDQKSFTFEQLDEIILFFGGDLVMDKEQTTASFEKLSGDRFMVYYNPDSNYMCALQELGRAFLHMDKMADYQKVVWGSNGQEDSNVELFARELMMPREEFEKVVIKYLDNGRFSASGVAKEYGVDVFTVIARCDDLNISEE